MGIGVKKLEVREVAIPFKHKFSHATHQRAVSDSVFVKLYLEDGTVGYGEALPRQYVTNESSLSIVESLAKLYKEFGDVKFDSFFSAVDFFKEFNSQFGCAARCCLELAFFDALGKYFKTSVSTIFENKKSNPVTYTGVVSLDSALSVLKNALLCKLINFSAVKVKVGVGNDLKRLAFIRSILGDKVDLRVDANGIWTVEEAIKNINSMRKFRISAVEQPVAKSDFEGIKQVTQAVSEVIIVDESLVTVDDALALAQMQACKMFNVRLSKCGGIMNSLKIVDIARKYGIKYQLGCHVGESSVLAAAGRHFIQGVDDLIYCEGAYAQYLLMEDVVARSLGFGWQGKAKKIGGVGLGVNVLDSVLNKYTLKMHVFDF